MSDPASPTTLSPYAYLAEGYLIFLRALRRHVKQRLADGESDDGWWKGPVRESLERHTVRSYKSGEETVKEGRWTEIDRLRKKRVDDRRPHEDFLDPNDLLLLVTDFHDRLIPEFDVHGARFRGDLIKKVSQWRNQFFAHPGSEPPSAEEVAGFLNPARVLLTSFNLPDEAQIKAICDAVAVASAERRSDPTSVSEETSDSFEDDRTRTVGAVAAGLAVYGDGGSVRLPIAREYAMFFLDASDDALFPQGSDLLNLLEEDDRVKVERPDDGTVWVSLSGPATLTDPPTPPTALLRTTSSSTPTANEDASSLAEGWLPRGIEAVSEVCYPNGWAPIVWCGHFLMSRYGTFPGSEADTGAVGAFFARHPDHFEVAGGFISGRVRLRQPVQAVASDGLVGKDDAAPATTAIQAAIDECAESGGWAVVSAVHQRLSRTSQIAEGDRLIDRLQARSDLYELRSRNKIAYVRLVGQVEELDGATVESLSDTEAVRSSVAPAQSRASGTEEVDKGRIAGRSPEDTAVNEPAPAQSQAVAGGSASPTVDRNEGSTQTRYPAWARVIERAIEESSDHSDGWAKVHVVRFCISEQRPSFDPGAWGFRTLRDLLASREDLFEIRDGRTTDSVGPDLVRIRAQGTDDQTSQERPLPEQGASSTDLPPWEDLATEAIRQEQGPDGWAYLGTAWATLRKANPNLSTQAYGFNRVLDLFASRQDLFLIDPDPSVRRSTPTTHRVRLR